MGHFAPRVFDFGYGSFPVRPLGRFSHSPGPADEFDRYIFFRYGKMIREGSRYALNKEYMKAWLCIESEKCILRI